MRKKWKTNAVLDILKIPIPNKLKSSHNTVVNVFRFKTFSRLYHCLRFALILYHSMFPNVTFATITTTTIPNPFECLEKRKKNMLVRYERERESFKKDLFTQSLSLK